VSQICAMCFCWRNPLYRCDKLLTAVFTKCGPHNSEHNANQNKRDKAEHTNETDRQRRSANRPSDAPQDTVTDMSQHPQNAFSMSSVSSAAANTWILKYCYSRSVLKPIHGITTDRQTDINRIKYLS